MTNAERAPWQDAAAKAFCHTLERMAFIFVEPMATDTAVSSGEEYVRGDMTFSGAAAGRIALVVPAALGPMLAANVLGMEEGNGRAAALAADAVREVLNVFCGTFLTAYYGREPVFDLTVPMISRVSPGEWLAMRQAPETLAFCLDEWPLLLQVSISAAGATPRASDRQIAKEN